MSERDVPASGPPAIDLDAEEFQDYRGPLLPAGFGFDLSRLMAAESLRGIAAVVVAVLVLRTPSRSPRGFAVLVGAILVAWAVGGAIDLRGSRPSTGWAWLRVAFLGLAGISFLVVEEFTGESLGRVFGAILIAGSVFSMVETWRTSRKGGRSEPVLGSVLYLAVGVTLVMVPLTILGLSVLILSAYWFITGLVTIVTNIRLDDRQIAPSNTWQMFLEWVQTRPSTADDRLQLYGNIFFEGAEQARRLSRFFVLMGFATAIAAWGIVADSTAVVIGAMLVAPLMTPLMGTALSMVMGWPRRASISGAVALAGVVFAIGLSVLFGWMYGPDISSVTNTQVASRIAPTLVDLIIAVAAGGAGAFALSRPDVSDSLPGVAVAIALVPPLAVVGLMVSQGNWGAASGASLLFLTNMVAILLVGGVVFVLTGVVPILRMAERRQWLSRSVGMVAILAIGVVAVLGVSAESFRRQTADLERASNLVEDWLGATDLYLSSATYSNGEYEIVLTGSDRPPPIEDLAADIGSEFGEEIPIQVTWVPAESFSFQP
jgi:uncharacterized hydrophobic protein (TIGR00271 family)